ncbi:MULTISPECIES: phosphoglycerate dehydrogenase [Lactobacillaceae]|uniref:phosphoglycerate dehydrogenase n=1 Tax=Lactobacillaceae TaxID=33958 RepID=UPI0025AF728F|nr:phosphoglycerate dehydrogenase [Leuconostoc sp. UCMA20149]MDN2452042.1 3-phosphoglycerate dehydrogenase [Leuconostoc sp. UCMA20149]
MSQTVAIPKGLSEIGKKYLKDHNIEIIELKSFSDDEILSKAKNADGIILMTDPFSNDLVRHLPNLKIVARHGVGYDNIDPIFLENNHIWATITPNANAETVAEVTIAEIFDLSKNITSISEKMRQGDFEYKNDHLGFNLSGKTIGIAGYGRIGKKVAQKADALGMDVIIYDPFVTQSNVGTLVSKKDLLLDSDIVTLHMAVTDDTKHFIDGEALKRMKSSSYLVNLGRGALVDQPALIDSLRNHEISGAALDVFDQEPLPLDNDLYKLDNVLLTPHIASNTTNAMNSMALDSAKEIVQVLSNKLPNWPINRVQ